ncbi:hypothetical protein [Rhodococcus jostii]|uniref:hypothetical protein n=1 Tax=Rhodococcus jostii TaxID=132919 RepID=UPI003660A6A0
MTAEEKTTEQPEVHWGTVVLHQSEPRRSHLVHGVGSALGVVTGVGAISAAVIALMLVVGGVGAAMLHLVWGTVDPARSEKVVGDFLNAVPEAGTTLLVALLLTGGAVGGLHLVNRHVRKHQPARITGAQLQQAPDELRQRMSDAVLAVEQIKGSRVFRDGMFTDVDLRAAMWDLGTRVLAATELQEAITAAAGTDPGMLTPEDQQIYTRARTQIEQAVHRRCATPRTPWPTWTLNSPPPRTRPASDTNVAACSRNRQPVSIVWPTPTPPLRRAPRHPRPRSPT